MYATLYHLYATKGNEQATLDQLFRWEQEILPTVTGFVTGYIFQPVAAPAESIGLFVFASEDNYQQVQDQPEHMNWYRELLLLVEAHSACRVGELTELLRESPGL